MRAAIYVRQSLDKARDGAAVDRQLAECQALAERNGWEIAEVYRDNDASATKGVRPEWTRLLGDLDAGRHDVLICWHTDRLYRRQRDVVDLLEIAERRSLRIASVKSGDLDLANPAGRYFAGQLAGMARYEVETKGARQVAANRARARHGTVLWTRRPFGFDREGHDIFIVESEAAEIRKASEAVLEGQTLTFIARDMNARGVRTSLGGTWTIKTLKQVLVNPRIAGRVIYRGEDMGVQGPAILDANTFERLNAVLTDPRRKYAPSTKVKHLLSGVVRCGRDGCDLEPMLFTTSGAERTPVYRCRRCYLTRRRDRVDEVVMGTIIARLSQPDAAELFTSDADLDGLRARVVELRGRRDGLAALLAEGLLGAEAVREQAKKLGVEIDEAQRQIDAAAEDHPVIGVLESGDVAAALEDLSIGDLREVIKVLCEVVILPAGKGIRFAPEQVRIDWRMNE